MLAEQGLRGRRRLRRLQLIAREKPNVADFDKDADQRVAELREKRAADVRRGAGSRTRCETLAKDGKIQPNPELIRRARRPGQARCRPQYRPVHQLPLTPPKPVRPSAIR